MRLSRRIRLIALAAAGLLLAGCTGLPTSGAPNPGLALDEEGQLPSFTPIAQGPQPGASPEGIVEGFLEAAMTPANEWEIAQEFLTEDLRRTWKPEVGVTIDSSAAQRQFTPTVDGEDEEATAAEVRVNVDQIASVDAGGAYSAASGTGTGAYRLVREEQGEWRISEAPDGIFLDADAFGQVYQKYSLKYFDHSWTHLVPDVRWFPRRTAMATSVTRALLSGQPSPWLAPAVRSAFTEDVALAGDAVLVDASQVASVSLTRTALSASSTELARMRTQLESSLAGAGVSEVRFTVDGAPLDAGTIAVDETIIDPGVLVLNDETFGTASGDELAPVGALTAQLAKFTDPIRSVDVSLSATLAAVQLRDGRVFAVSAGNSDELDQRAGLIEPSLDPFGYTWTVPRGDPAAVQAWSPQVERHPIGNAWPNADSVTHLRVAADGARVAAVLTTGSLRTLVVAAIVRGEDSEPVEIGELYEVARLTEPAQGIAWVGSDSIALLSSGADQTLTTYVVGGPSTSTAAPERAISLAGARSTTGLRVLSSDGAVYAQRGTSWQVSVEDALVLGTRAGY